MTSYSVIKAAIKSQSFGNYLSINGANMSAASDVGAGSATTTKTIDATSTLYIEVCKYLLAVQLAFSYNPWFLRHVI